jgi:isochorismate hydrolase
VLFTAHDAYMRDFNLVVPRDCLASEDEADNRHALAHMANTCKAHTAASAAIDFGSLRAD